MNYRIKLEEPIPLTNRVKLAKQIMQIIETQHHIKVNPNLVLDIDRLAKTPCDGPLIGLSNCEKNIEAYELAQRRFPHTREMIDTLHTFIGSTGYLPLERFKSIDSSWRESLIEKGIDKTNVYIVEQVGCLYDIGNFWRELGRNIAPFAEPEFGRKEIYWAYPIAEPFDFFYFPHPPEFGYESPTDPRFLRKSEKLKEKMRIYLESVLGREIKPPVESWVNNQLNPYR